MSRARLGIDVGGTFTDLVALIDGSVVTAKVPSTPRDQSQGVMGALEASGIERADVDALAHGMTVATNALLERRGARTALVTTEGFRDVIEIARQNRSSLYDLTEDRPPPLIPRDLRFVVEERMGPDGVLVELDRAALPALVDSLESSQVEAVAVCLLFAFLHPEHERAVGDLLRSELDGVHVSLSHEVLPEFREYERFSTTVADAYLGPKLSAYLENLSRRVTEAGMPAPLVMQSSGGVIDIETAAHSAASCVLSGPAGGAVGAAYVCGLSGYRDLLTFDMGGTSTDVAPVVNGEVQTTTESVVAGVPIKFPMVDIHTVSAGGGSVAWADKGGALRVGPHSAGAEPGPACYGRGGSEPAVTDADLYLGFLPDGAVLGGEVALRRELAESALSALGETLGMDTLAAALGVARVAEAEMARALRVISVQRGLDPREFVLVAFGGAGPVHACALAEEVGMPVVLVPKASGVLSALGLAISDLRRDYVSPFISPLESVEADSLEDLYVAMETRGRKELKEPEFQRRADLRYEGQSFELTVEASSAQHAVAAFHEAHERRYGYRMPAETVEFVNLRLTATGASERPELSEPDADGDARRDTRRANLDGVWVDVPVFDRTCMGRDSDVSGPAVVEFPEATCVVRPGWSGAIDGRGTLVLERR